MREIIESRHKIEMWHRDRIKIVSNVRKAFAEEELRRLGRSYKKRWIMPLIVMPDGTLIDGERRFRGGCLEGMEQFPVQVVDRVLSALEIAETQLLSAVHRADLGDHERAVAMRDIKAAHSEMTAKQLAEEVLNIDPSGLMRYLSLFERCIQPVQDAAKEGRLTVTKWYAIGKLPEQQQAAALALALSGTNRDDLESHGRKQRNGNSSTPAVKVSRLRCALPSGVSVQFSGEGIDLETAIEAMKDLTAELKRALDQGLDSRTVVRVLADKAKAKG
jgi:ParB family transcriptional regulator, chromosome partitioning protein